MCADVLTAWGVVLELDGIVDEERLDQRSDDEPFDQQSVDQRHVDQSVDQEPEEEVDPLAGPMAGAPDQVIVRIT